MAQLFGMLHVILREHRVAKRLENRRENDGIASTLLKIKRRVERGLHIAYRSRVAARIERVEFEYVRHEGGQVEVGIAQAHDGIARDVAAMAREAIRDEAAPAVRRVAHRNPRVALGPVGPAVALPRHLPPFSLVGVSRPGSLLRLPHLPKTRYVRNMHDRCAHGLV